MVSDKAIRIVKIITIFGGMLVFGTCTVVIQKLVFSMESLGSDDEVKDFEKPWFQTEVMFVGMALCVVVYWIMLAIKKFSKKKSGDESVNEPKKGNSSSEELSDDQLPFMEKLRSPMFWKKIGISCAKSLYLGVPALCDLVATAMMNVGLLWLPASIWQMLRGSMTIFSAFITHFVRRRKLPAFRWAGVAVVAFALLVVGVSAVGLSMDQNESRDPNAEHTPTYLVIVGAVLVLVAQVVQASQIVLEEFFLKDMKTDPILIVGLEGVYGGIVCTAVVLPIVGALPSSWPIYEDTVDTFVKMGNNPTILGLVFAYAVAILGYNIFGMLVTSVSSAVFRTIFEGLRTACIWLTNLVIFYSMGPQDPDDVLGEAWTDWSYLELCGFLFLLVGLFVYNGMLRINGLDYSSIDKPKTTVPIEEKKMEEEKDADEKTSLLDKKD